MKGVTIGADPELFVQKDYVPVSAFGMIPGTKEEPFPVKCGAVQVDGMALEFNINPASSYEEFEENIKTVMEDLKAMIPPDHEFYIKPYVKFGREYIDEQPDKAKELGCDPDFDAYTGEANEAPDGNKGIRTAAGHIHIGIDRELSEIEKRQLVVLCDLFIGIPSLAWDSCRLRSSMYGKPGCYRPKPYGIEYRTPSCKWLLSEEYMREVYDGAIYAVKALPDFAKFITEFEQEWCTKDLGYLDIRRTLNRRRFSYYERDMLNWCRDYVNRSL